MANRKKNSYAIQFSAIFIVVFFSLSMTPKADAWSGGIPGAIFKQAMEKIYDTIQGSILSGLKTAAITVLNTQTMSLIGGTSGGSPVISDWKSFLYNEPETKVLAYKEQLFNSIFAGRNTSMYQSMMAEQDAGINDYYSMLEEQTKGFDTASDGSLRANAADILGKDPAFALAKGDLKALSALLAKPTNNPYGLSLTVESMVATEQNRLAEIQKMKATSTGYKPVEKNGLTVLPGSTVGTLVANTQDTVSKVIAAANNPQELIGGVVSGMANRMITSMMGKVTSEIQTKIGAVDRQISSQVKEINKALGPAATLSTKIQQQTGIYVNPTTNPGLAVPKTCLTPGC